MTRLGRLLTGLYFYRARYYDSRTGRFVSEDPIRFEGGEPNRYRYVLNNPTNFVDPTGQSTIAVLFVGAFCAGLEVGNLIEFGIDVIRSFNETNKINAIRNELVRQQEACFLEGEVARPLLLQQQIDALDQTQTYLIAATTVELGKAVQVGRIVTGTCIAALGLARVL